MSVILHVLSRSDPDECYITPVHVLSRSDPDKCYITCIIQE